jgi:hypothetical protein
VSILETTAPAATQVVSCAVAAYATHRAAADALPLLRQTPCPLTGEPLAPAFYKHADDQTVVALAAVFDAIRNHGLDARTFHDWGVLAAPRFLGRAALATALNRFALEGAWGISPHLIPHRSLHSISGTISQALKIKGPNFGVGGGPHAADEAILVAGGMVSDEQLPGVWLVMTGYNPELVPGDPAGNGDSPVGQATSLPRHGRLEACPTVAVEAVALALVRKGLGASRLRLRIAGTISGSDGIEPVSWPPFRLDNFLDVLTNKHRAPAVGWRLRGGWMALEAAATSAET